jgi:hypothetical protein
LQVRRTDNRPRKWRVECRLYLHLFGFIKRGGYGFCWLEGQTTGPENGWMDIAGIEILYTVARISCEIIVPKSTVDKEIKPHKKIKAPQLWSPETRMLYQFQFYICDKNNVAVTFL